MGLPEKAVEPIEAIKRGAWHPPRPTNCECCPQTRALVVRPKNFKPADARLSAKGDWSISVDMAEKAGGDRLRAHGDTVSPLRLL